MKLITWLQAKHGRRGLVAQATGLHLSYIDYIARGKRSGTAETISAISAATVGEVTVQELLYPDGVPDGAVMCPPKSEPARTQAA